MIIWAIIRDFQAKGFYIGARGGVGIGGDLSLPPSDQTRMALKSKKKKRKSFVYQRTPSGK